jgi:hypothetical protein
MDRAEEEKNYSELNSNKLRLIKTNHCKLFARLVAFKKAGEEDEHISRL